LAYAQLDCPQAAIQDLEAYLAERPYAADANAIRSKMSELREACKRLN
jgi:regulator of sirC expression with transglutaminase-like and TPR domain